MNAPDRDVHSWFRDAVEMENITPYDITPVARYEWSTGITPSDFTIPCAVCENTVTSDGEMARIDGEPKLFCCPSCKSAYERRYESLKPEAN